MTLTGVRLFSPVMPRSARDLSPRASLTRDHAQVPPAVVPFFQIVVRSAQAAKHPRCNVSELPPRHR